MQYLVLDTNILGMLCHPNAKKFAELKEWAFNLLIDNSHCYTLCLPEIADYELRRKLLHIALKNNQDSSNSIKRLDDYHNILHYLPIKTETMRVAAQLWAASRVKGEPTAVPLALDGDVILAAQVKACNGIVLTTNKKHLSRFVPVADWESYQLR